MNKYFVNDIGIYAEHDRFVREVLINGEYKYLFNYDVVVDAGANIGSFSVWIYPYAKTIYALEPSPEPMKLLLSTIGENELTNIIPLKLALAGESGTRYLKDTDDTHHQYGSASFAEEGLEVRAVSLEVLMRECKIDYIDLLKLDVEGAEVEILESTGFSDVANRVGTIIGEQHGGDRRERCKRALENVGFKFTDVGTHFLARKI